MSGYRFRAPEFHDGVQEEAARSGNEARFNSYHIPAETNGKTAAIALVSIVMGLGVLGFFGLAIWRAIA